MSRLSSVLSVFPLLLAGLVVPRPVYAAAPSYLPPFFQDVVEAFTSSGTGYIQERIQAGLVLLFALVFIVAVAFSALAAIKFISSQGEAQKLEESKGAVKAILMGFAAMLVAIIGIFVVMILFQGDPEDYPFELPENLVGT